MILDHIVDVAASALGGAVKGLRTVRLHEPGALPGTGLEPDGAFYVGERARAYRAGPAAGKEAADARERTRSRGGGRGHERGRRQGRALRRSGGAGASLLDGRPSAEVPRVEFLALQPRKKPRRLTSSNVLPNLTPEDVSEAVGVARIVLRRQRGSVLQSGRGIPRALQSHGT